MQLARALSTWFTCSWVLLSPFANAAAAETDETLPSEAFISKTTGEIALSLSHDSPLFVEFDGSPGLTIRLAQALESLGFLVATDRSAAVASLKLKGEIALRGGPQFYKGVQMPLGQVSERAIAIAQGQTGPNRADFVQATAGAAINYAGLQGAVGPFWRGLYMGNLLNVLADASGAHGAINKALTGDPRGICLSHCGDWKKVHQTAYLSVVFEAGESKREIRVLTSAFSEAIAPDQVINRALTDAVAAIKIDDAGASPQPN